MSKRDDDKFLIKIKGALMIPESESYADSELLLHINGCTQLLTTMGITINVAESDNPLVEGIILIYIKTYFGFKNDGSVKELPPSFDLLVRQLALTQEESQDVS